MRSYANRAKVTAVRNIRIRCAGCKRSNHADFRKIRRFRMSHCEHADGVVLNGEGSFLAKTPCGGHKRSISIAIRMKSGFAPRFAVRT